MEVLSIPVVFYCGTFGSPAEDFGKYSIIELRREIYRLLGAYCNHRGRRIPIEDLAAECGKPQACFPMKAKGGLLTGNSSHHLLSEDSIKTTACGGESRVKTVKRVIFVSFVVFALLCPLAYAEEGKSAKNWEWNLTPLYLWAVNMNGELAVANQSIPVVLDFDQIFDTLEAFISLHFEGLYKKKWGFLFDIMHTNIAGSTTLPGPFSTTLRLDFEQTLVELGGIYRFYEKGPHIFEGLGGARFTNMDTEVTITSPLPILPSRLESNQEWWDPIVGLRYKWQISEKWKLILRGDIGVGFGAGDTSDSTWNLVGLIFFQAWKHVGFLGGYRALDVDYESGSGINQFKYDMLMHGPGLAVNITW
jgi:hypothetical protein